MTDAFLARGELDFVIRGKVDVIRRMHRQKDTLGAAAPCASPPPSCARHGESDLHTVEPYPRGLVQARYPNPSDPAGPILMEHVLMCFELSASSFALG
jgi:hypothetical protein